MFEPIAVIGRGCVLPGALTPQALWKLLYSGKDVITESVNQFEFSDHKAGIQNIVSSNRGAYISGFNDVFDPNNFKIPQDDIENLDPVFKWLLYCAREALNEADQQLHNHDRTGFIAGNLSYPTSSLVQYANAVWHKQHEPDSIGCSIGTDEALATPINRFMSGAPSHIVAKALNLGGISFCLDAACASSLYAIKLACDQLQDHKADLMLAGAANNADDLYLHAGFTALHALSPSGRSRPFHQDADGLIPAEGAAVIVLKRLADAKADNDKILGVIRGIGLSNDGHSKGFLAPSSEGQMRAMHAAYKQSDISPSDITFVECHATGTAIGDSVEISSMKEIFSDSTNLPIGSMKSNMGHLITTSGMASILKILGAMENRTLPPSINCDTPSKALNNSSLRLISKAEPWVSDKPLRAAISNFGFGGNNAHLILEQIDIDISWQTKKPCTQEPVAIIAVNATIGNKTAKDFSNSLFDKSSNEIQPASEISLNIQKLNIPPLDLKKSLAQQTMLLATGFEAIQQVKHFPVESEKIGTYIGMQCDVESCRYNLRWKLPSLISDYSKNHNIHISDDQIKSLQDDVVPTLDSARVIGCMPNLPANRLNTLFNWGGASFTVSSEELSGITALQLACRSLQRNELDTAVVGAVDLSCEPVHSSAVEKLLPTHFHKPCDAAVVLVLKRLSDAKRDRERIFAIIEDDNSAYTRPTSDLTLDINDKTITSRFGHSHVASGLLHVAAGAISCANRRIPPKQPADESMPWLPSLKKQYLTINARSFTGQRATVRLTASEDTHGFANNNERGPQLYIYAASDRESLLHNITENSKPGGEGPVKLAVIATGREQLETRLLKAHSILSNNKEIATGESTKHEIYFRAKPIVGELAFVFTGAAAAYQGMGRELLITLPSLAKNLQKRFPKINDSARWIYESTLNKKILPFDKLRGASFLSQIHNELSQNVLGLKPTATIGLSSGETNALFAMQAWQDIDDMYADIEASGIYTHSLAGNFRSASTAWKLKSKEKANWENWHLRSAPEEVQLAIDQDTRVHITIIQSTKDCVIGGEPSACKRVIDTIGASKAFPLQHDMIAHCPELQESADIWHRIHHRTTHKVEGVRFYSNATNTWYHPDANSTSSNLLSQAVKTINFPGTILNAWQDGVRVFLEHGPSNSQTTAIKNILGKKDHIALSLDQRGKSDICQLLHVCAQLIVAGIEVDYRRLEAQLQPSVVTKTIDKSSSHWLNLPAHPEPVNIPNIKRCTEITNGEVMEPAPILAPVAHNNAILSSESTLKFGSKDAPKTKTESPPIDPLLDTIKNNQSSEKDALISAVAIQHQHFIKTQTRLHQKFLELFGHKNSPPSILNSKTVSNQSEKSLHDRKPKQISDKQKELSKAAVTNNASQSIPITTEVSTLPTPQKPHGQRFNRLQLENLASGSIAQVFGPQFEYQSHYDIQVRMPMPPLLLADRVTGLDAEPGSMSEGTIWTETDVKNDAWYMHANRMRPGITIESGQADLLLISWLGADSHNKGKRAYRLLGCDLTYHDGGMPIAGDVLRYEISIDGHARQGDIRLFFFHYDCWIKDRLLLSVRNGQAGFFTRNELDNSDGVLWKAEDDTPLADARVDSPTITCTKKSFTTDEVKAFANGNAYACFGTGFEITATHQRTPNIPTDRMKLIQKVTQFNPKGGPWGRGYLLAESTITDDEWFFNGHFLNDPCMPGTLMADAALQAMAFYITALGFTVDKDGWIFEPVPNNTFKFLCRGQVTPGIRKLRYEIHIEEIISKPYPTIYAAIICYGDNLKVFHCRRYGLRLVPDWPLSSRSHLLSHEKRFFVDKKMTVRGDKDAILAYTWGKPSDSLGPLYKKFDDVKRCPRLPGPPYLFLSRILNVDCEPGEIRVGSKVTAEFDLNANAWFYNQYPNQSMPFCVLLEALLQPCGWLSIYMGFPTQSEHELFFRNLDGNNAKQLIEITASDSGVLTTHVTLTNHSQVGNLALLSFHVNSYTDNILVMEFDTSFGFFDSDALATQVGLPTTEQQRQFRDEDDNFYLDLHNPPPLFLTPKLLLPQDKLLMLDTITGYWPDAGEKSLGRIRGSQKINVNSWYFKAHFYQDSVQPGSLGLEALLQLLQCYMLQNNLQEGITNPRFEPIALNQAFIWKYRGQVRPTNKKVITELEITSIDRRNNNVLVLAKGSLWVDGLRIYEVEDMGMRITSKTSLSAITSMWKLDTTQQAWLKDHRPTFCNPTLSFTILTDYIAKAAQKCLPMLNVIEIKDVKVLNWVTIPDEVILIKADAKIDKGNNHVYVTLYSSAESPKGEDTKPRNFTIAATGTVTFAKSFPPQPKPIPALTNANKIIDPYQTLPLFHGPAFQLLKYVARNAEGCTAIIDAASKGVPYGLINPAALDSSLHVINHQDISLWLPELASFVIFPSQILQLSLFANTPQKGDIRCETRPLGIQKSSGFPMARIQLISDNIVWADMIIAARTFPKSPLDNDDPKKWRSFFRDHQYIKDYSISKTSNGKTHLTRKLIQNCERIPGTLRYLYNIEDTDRNLAATLAAKEHISQKTRIHPHFVKLEANNAYTKNFPLTVFPIKINENFHDIYISDGGPSYLDLHIVENYWRTQLLKSAVVIENIIFSLARRTIRKIEIINPKQFKKIHSRSVLYVASHQTFIESMLFTALISSINNSLTHTIARIEYRNTWAGKLLNIVDEHPEHTRQEYIIPFDRNDQASMFTKIESLKKTLSEKNESLLVHIEGKRTRQCRQPVKKLSSIFVDLAIATDTPIVPVRFAGGLPIECADNHPGFEFPVGYGKQDIYLGDPIFPDELSALPLKERIDLVLNAINTTGPDIMLETPAEPDLHFANEVNEWKNSQGIDEEYAAIFKTLEYDTHCGDTIKTFVQQLKTGTFSHDDSPEGLWLKQLAVMLGGKSVLNTKDEPQK